MESQSIQTSFKLVFKWLSIMFLMAAFFVGLSYQTQAAKAADITASMSGISASDALYDGQPVTSTTVANWDKSSYYRLNYNFTIKAGTQVKTGDTATVSLPTGTHFHDLQNFDLKSPDGSVVGHFSAAAGATTGTITFTDYFTKNNNDMGGHLEFDVSGDADGGGTQSGNYVNKAGFPWQGTWKDGKNYDLDQKGNFQYVEWDAKINPNKKTLTNVSVTDTMQNTTSQQLLPDTMALEFDSTGAEVPASDYQITYLPTSESPTSFTIKWNGTLNQAVNILYLAKVTDTAYRTTGSAITLNNKIKISGTDKGDGSGAGSDIDVASGAANAHVNLGGNGGGSGTAYDLNVTKKWVDVPNGVTTPAIKAELYANGKSTGKIITLDTANQYSGTFSGLNEKDSDGKKITYTVAEVKVPDGYSGTTTPQSFDKDNNATLTNKYNPETPSTRTIKVNKVWQGVPTGVQTPEVTATLYANGKSTGKTVTLNQANHYSDEFTDIPETDSSGKTITYTVIETSIPTGYSSDNKGVAPVVNGTATLKNIYTAKTTTTITVKKNWQGVPNGTTTPSVVATLYANGKSTGKTVTLNGSNGYRAEFDNLPQTDADGQAIVYTVVESAVDGYTPTVNGQISPKNGVVTLTNVYQPKKTPIKVKKVWQDGASWYQYA
ncbi:Collagen adhesin precursor [Lentilactobacillus parabuchneri]|uniref:Cna B-type domain-containing protein n=1 Tax=Lentilactobacillus parabuchneri TaxID=152331 RepID=UPI000A110AE4|nr:Cna B-type domain-containing protein [Lentilactobacillus parabuchneri]ORN39623.1 Collagen adhesin precursor [Lentilactobacillus parabuchneri]